MNDLLWNLKNIEWHCMIWVLIVLRYTVTKYILWCLGKSNVFKSDLDKSDLISCFTRTNVLNVSVECIIFQATLLNGKCITTLEPPINLLFTSITKVAVLVVFRFCLWLYLSILRYIIEYSVSSATAWKVSVFRVILVQTFTHSGWIKIDTPDLSLFSPNAGK